MLQDAEYRNRLINSAVKQVNTDLVRFEQENDRIECLSHRPTMEFIKHTIGVMLVNHDSFDSELAINWLNKAITHLHRLQLESGLFNGGDNLVSPPDSAFTINDICLVIELLNKQKRLSENLIVVRDELLSIAQQASPAMKTGGVHTPNHRWEIANVLVGLGFLLHDDECLLRANQWLAEHIDIQSDGLYSERSPNYSVYVSNPCLISLARRLHNDSYLAIVNRDLYAIAGLIEPNGLLETMQSRRQDQFKLFDPAPFVSQARLLANIYHTPEVVAFAKDLSNREFQVPARHLVELLMDERIGQMLPRIDIDVIKEPEIRDYSDTKMSRVFLSGTVGKPESAATVYAGSDFSSTWRVASGLANNTSLLDYWTKGVSITGLKLAPDFFNLGPIRPDYLRREGTHFTLIDTRISGYYQPLDTKYINPNGDYMMTDESRFFAKMAFDQRSRDDMTLVSIVDICISRDGFIFKAHFDGPETVFACALGIAGDELQIEGDVTLDKDTYIAQHDATVRCISANGELMLTSQGAPALGLVRYDAGEAMTFTGGSDRIVGIQLEFSGSTTQDFVLRAAWNTRN